MQVSPSWDLEDRVHNREATYVRFFFSSRRRHTRLQGDWSSDVCSSDLVVMLAYELVAAHGLIFGGIDLSPAPLGEDSITAAMELCGYGPFGTTGTLAVSAAVTAALKNTGMLSLPALPTCGYCGLMLPVLEDAALGRRWE